MRYLSLGVLLISIFMIGCSKRQTVNPLAQKPEVQLETTKPFPEQPVPKPEEAVLLPTGARATTGGTWRVQIFVSGTRENALRVAEEARWKFIDQQVFVAEQPPYYKVQVGRGLSRQAAEVLKQRARELGYRDAFAVEVVR